MKWLEIATRDQERLQLQMRQVKFNCQRAAEAKGPRLRGGSIIEPRVYLDVQGEKISSDPEKR